MSAAAPPSSGHSSLSAKSVALWIGTVLLSCLFLMSGTMKFVTDDMARQFEEWGYTAGFCYLIGVVEITSALLLLVPRTAFFAAGALAIVMIGAIYTHFSYAEYTNALVPLVTLFVLVLVGYARRPEA